MTDGSKKIWRSLILRSMGSVFLGGAVVMAFVMILSLYGSPQETNPMVTAQSRKSSALKFPENEAMLDTLSTQLAQQGASLSAIEPAAGNEKPAIQKFSQ